MRNSCFSSIYFTFWTVCASEAYKSRAKPIYLEKQSATALYLCPFQKNKSVASTAKVWQVALRRLMTLVIVVIGAFLSLAIPKLLHSKSLFTE